MDKCKYFLKIGDTQINFNSDAELTEFVKRNLGGDKDFKELTPIKPGVSELFESNSELANQIYEALGFNFRYTSEKWKDDPTKENKATYINIKGTPSNQEFQVKKDIEEGFYSVHFKTEQGKLTKEQIQILVDAIASQIPIGGKLSTHGEITKGGISGLNRFLNNGFKKVGDREIKDREGNPVIIPILEKVEKSNLEQQAQQLYSQYLESLEKPDTNPILQGSQQEQVKKFAELQERLNNKEFIEGAKDAYESTPALQQFGTQEEYNDYIARVSLGIVKNPSSGGYNYTSQVKDIVYHGGSPAEDFSSPEFGTSGFHGYFAANKIIADEFAKRWTRNKNTTGKTKAVLFNLTNPDITNKLYKGEYKDSVSYIKSKINEGIVDGIIAENTSDKFSDIFGDYDQYVVFEPNQIHILGSKQDIEGFKNFVEKQTSKIETTGTIGQRTPSLKFSKEGNIGNEQENVVNSIMAPNGNNPAYSNTFMSESQFFKEKHSIDGLAAEYLAPTLIDSEYIKEAVKELVKTKYKTTYEVDPEQAKALAEKEVKFDLSLDKKMSQFSTLYSKIFDGYFKRKGSEYIEKQIDELINLTIDYNKTVDKSFKYTEKEVNSIKQNIKERTREWFNQTVADQSKEFLSNVWLNKQQPINSSNGISSPVSLLAISDGDNPIIDIYEIKVSRIKFDEWHSAKKLRTDYKLGLNRQLLDGIVPSTVDVANSSLFVLPIWLPTDSNGLLRLEDFAIDSLKERSAESSVNNNMLGETGIITTNLRKLFPIPSKENLKESDEALKLIDKVLTTAFPKYNFRTKIRNSNAKALIEKALANASGRTEIRIKNHLTGERIIEPNTPEGIERFKKRVDEYVEELNNTKDTSVTNIIKIIRTAKSNGRFTSNKLSDGFIRTFGKYLSDEWEMVTNRPEFTSNGVILFKNVNTLIAEPVAITVNNLPQITNMGLGTTVVGKFQKDSDFKNNSNIWSASNKNIEVIKTLLILNTVPSTLQGYKLGFTQVFDLATNTSDSSMVFKEEAYNFNLLWDHVSKDLSLENNFKNKKITRASFVDVLYADILAKLIPLDNQILMGEFNQIPFDDLFTNQERLTWFRKFKDAIEKEYPHLKTGVGYRISDYDKDIDYIYSLVSLGITEFSNIKNTYDIAAPEFGITAEDVFNLPKAVFGKKGAPKYDKSGNKIVGIVQGYQFSTSDSMPSKFIGDMLNIVTIAMNRITVDYNKFKNPVINNTKAMYEELGRLKAEQVLLGDADKFYEPFFEKDGSKISHDFKLLNPWGNTPTLTDAQRKYLKKFIYFLYLAHPQANHNLDTYEKFEKSEDLQTMLSTGEIERILRVPLMRKKATSVWKKLSTDGFWKFIGNTKDTVLNELDYREATGAEAEYEQEIGVMKEANNLGKIYNRFNAQIHNDSYREGLIEEYGVSHWEINLDTIILSFAYENFKEKYLNQAMITVKAAVESLKFHGAQHGKTEEVEKVIKTLIDQLKVSVYNISPLKGTESEKFFSLVKTAQKITSLMVLAFRPAMFVKEIVVGTLKNTSYAWSKIYGEDSFDGKHLTEAYEKLFTREDWDLIMEINNLYRVANRDLNQIVDKTKVDRHGLNFFGNFMYWSNTAPDYINRLALFFAKALKDGSYKAHSLDSEGNLIYDARKDERYSYYLQMRDRYNYQIHKTDTKYNDQRALYLAQIKTFNEEAIFEGDTLLEEKDLLPQAYTNKEKESIVTFTAMAYGYYDHERTPLIKHGPIGILFGQFMTFWPAKVKYYFAPEGTESKRGHFNHKHTIVDGKKTYYYLKYSKDEEGNDYVEEVPETELTPEDGRMKAIEWVGDPMEGLMTSLGLTARHLFTGNSIDEIDPQRLNNAKVMLHDIIVAMLSILFGLILFGKVKGIDVSAKGSGPTKWSEMDQYERLAAKIILNTTNEFDPISLLGSVQSTPTFVTALGKLSGDFNNLFTGHTDMETFFRNNFRFLENVPNPMTRMGIMKQ